MFSVLATLVDIKHLPFSWSSVIPFLINFIRFFCFVFPSFSNFAMFWFKFSFNWVLVHGVLSYSWQSWQWAHSVDFLSWFLQFHGLLKGNFCINDRVKLTFCVKMKPIHNEIFFNYEVANFSRSLFILDLRRPIGWCSCLHRRIPVTLSVSYSHRIISYLYLD